MNRLLLQLRRLRRDARGATAIEFALVVPILATLLVCGFDGWSRLTQARDMRAALQTSARYYLTGGGDDAQAQTMAMSAWTNAPSDKAVTVTRACMCGTSTASCTNLCSDSSSPQVLITLGATGTFTGMTGTQALSETEVIRVQ